MKGFIKLKREVICGIYKITNKDNGKVYVGQSSDILKRFATHQYELKGGYHINKPLQNSYNVHGENAFEYSVVEKCSEEDLNERECFWIAELHAMVPEGYNLTAGGEGTRGYTWSEDMYKKFEKEVVCLNTMERFRSAQCAAEYAGTDGGSISACCSKKRSCAGRHNGEPLVWAYADEFDKVLNVDAYIAERIALANSNLNYEFAAKNRKEILCLNTMERYDGLGEAAAASGLSVTGISNCCTGRSAYIGKEDGVGLIWVHAEDYDSAEDKETFVCDRMRKMEYALNRRYMESQMRCVVCLNNAMEFRSIQEAAEWSHCQAVSIGSVASGDLRSTISSETGERLVWRYYEDYLTMTEAEIQKALANTDKNHPDYDLPCAKSVVCLNNGVVYGSIKEVVQKLGIGEPSLSSCCNKKINSAGCDPATGERYTFRFKSEYDKMSQEEICKAIQKANNPGSRTPVRCLETGEVFESASAAARKYSIASTSISSVCRHGKQKHAGKHPETGVGLTWEYASVDEINMVA